jgi:hypothetical protein
MNDGIGNDQRVQPAGRTISVVVYGNTADEVELAALDEARGFFGADRRLEVVRDYRVVGTLAVDGTSKKYRAAASVRTVES